MKLIQFERTNEQAERIEQFEQIESKLREKKKELIIWRKILVFVCSSFFTSFSFLSLCMFIYLYICSCCQSKASFLAPSFEFLILNFKAPNWNEWMNERMNWWSWNEWSDDELLARPLFSF